MIKTYHSKLNPNKIKHTNLLNIFNSLQEVSKYFFEKDFIITPKTYNEIYAELRSKFPKLNSKLIQALMREYKTRKNKPTKAINMPIIIDQDFNIQHSEDKHFSAFIRFFRINYPLKGLYGISNIKDKSVKQITIKYKKESNIFHIYFQTEIENNIITNTNTLSLGLDCNTKNVCLSNNKFYSLKRFMHRKLEYRKHKQATKVANYTKDTIHKLTSKISKEIFNQGIKVLYLEDLTNIRDNSSKKKGTSKGKKLNYIINNAFPFRMFQDFLLYKCLHLGIKVEKIPASYTSKTCHKCGSLNTLRINQASFECLNCHVKIHADLNAARNIQKGKSFLNEQQVNPAQRAVLSSFTA